VGDYPCLFLTLFCTEKGMVMSAEPLTSNKKFFPDHAFNGKIVFGLRRLDVGDALYVANDFYSLLNQARCQYSKRNAGVTFHLTRDEYGCVLTRTH
jgi:hypothetical protein